MGIASREEVSGSELELSKLAHPLDTSFCLATALSKLCELYSTQADIPRVPYSIVKILNESDSGIILWRIKHPQEKDLPLLQVLELHCSVLETPEFHGGAKYYRPQVMSGKKSRRSRRK